MHKSTYKLQQFSSNFFRYHTSLSLFFFFLPACMENQVSQNPNHGKTPDEINDAQDLTLCFGNLIIGRDGNLEVKNPKKTKNHSDVAQETSGTTQWLPENHFSDRRSIWGYQFFLTEVEDFGSNLDKGSYDDLFKSENFDAGSSSQEPTMESFCSYPSISDSVSHLESNPIFYEDSRFMPTAIYNYENYQFRGRAKNGFCYSYHHGTTNDDLQQEIDTFLKENYGLDYGVLMEILEGGEYEQIKTLILTLQGSYLSLMTDRRMFSLFPKLLDACSTDQLLNLIAEDVLSRNHLFINTAFCKQGASSMIKLIKKLKKSRHAFTVTKLLSTRFLEIMTDFTARVVIQHCFIYFRNEPNEILYEKAVHHFQQLAVHKVGCRALNETIDVIAGNQRLGLLNLVADQSAYLSHDPYGNYVVQNVLSLKNQDVSTKIVLSLRGEFVELAKKTGGSHIVEKCMESSEFGLVTVVGEILDNPRRPFQLAQDIFGNYVIQKALKRTKEKGCTGLYYSLVKSLLPYLYVLTRTPGGKNVLNLVKDDGGMEMMYKAQKCMV